MARRAVDVLRDPVRHSQMREAARSRAAIFSSEVIVPQYEAYYQHVLGQ